MKSRNGLSGSSAIRIFVAALLRCGVDCLDDFFHQKATAPGSKESGAEGNIVKQLGAVGHALPHDYPLGIVDEVVLTIPVQIALLIDV